MRLAAPREGRVGSQVSLPPGGSLSTDVYGYGASNNRLVQITNGATTVRSLSYDNAGNLTSDSGLAGSRTYTYNKRNRDLRSVVHLRGAASHIKNRLSNALIGAISWDYTYNGQEQLIIRQRTGSTALGDLTHYVHDIYGNVIAETNGGGPTGSTGTVREYIYLHEAEIAPTFGSRTSVDRPIGVVEGVNTASPVLWFVHVDHLNRPVKMTDTAKAAVWDAIFLPWGGVHAITGSATLDARFPGQWFQLESGLHYNWHRQYDPSIGRYTQPDPLGFVDGPSVYGYARGMPQALFDKDGRAVQICIVPGLCPAIARTVVQMCTAAIGAYIASKPTPVTCTKATNFHLRKAGITDEEGFKIGENYRPSSRFDICACSDGSIRIGTVAQCGRQNSSDMGYTGVTWK